MTRKPDFYYQIEDDPEEEREILGGLEKGTLKRSANAEMEMAIARQATENYSRRKDGRITLRLPTEDINLVKARAMEEGLPYQSLIGSIIHKYVTGRLVEKGSGA